MTTALVPTDLDQRAAEVQRQVAAATAQAEAMQVRDQAGADNAGALLRAIKRREKESETERTALVRPLNDTVKLINQKFKDAAAPYKEADKIVRGKLGVWAAEQKRIRAAEEARLEAERQERERKAREARERQEAEQRAERERAEEEEREAAQLAAEAKDAEDREVADRLAWEAAEKVAEAQTAEAAIASLPEVQLPKAVVETAPKQQGVSTRKVWKTRVIDPAAVPREYLVVDEGAIRRAVRDGIREIPGVEIWQEDQMSVRAAS